MRREVIAGIIIGLLLGSGILAPGAGFRSANPQPVEPAAVKPASLPQARDVEVPLSHYQEIDERDLFRPAISPAPPPPPVRSPSAGLPSFPEAVWRSPAEGWTYAGYVVLDGEPMAVLQEPNSGQAAFLHLGENFRGGQVEEITPTAVRIEFGENVQILPKSEEYNTVPLNETSAAAAPTSPYAGRRAGGMAGGAVPSAMPMRAWAGRSQQVPSAPADLQQRAAQLRAEWEARRRRMMEAGQGTAASEDSLSRGMPARMPRIQQAPIQDIEEPVQPAAPRAGEEQQ
jgi:hypothetical protein